MRRFQRIVAFAVLLTAVSPLPQDALAVCGDTFIDPGEDCDDGNAVTETLPYGQQAPCEVCDATCHTRYDQCQWCGDNVPQAAHEQCDDGGTPDPAYPNQANCAGCDDQCRDKDVCYWCGDGVVDYLFGETCDDGNAVGGDGCTACVDDCIDAYTSSWRIPGSKLALPRKSLGTSPTQPVCPVMHF